MKRNGSPNCAWKHGGNDPRPASTYTGMESIGSALPGIRQTGGTRTLLAIVAGT